LQITGEEKEGRLGMDWSAPPEWHPDIGHRWELALYPIH
jgi:hypothetical protein